MPLQIFLGDQHGLNTREHQPAKLAAIEARWETGRRVPLTLFAIPTRKPRTTISRSTCRCLGSLILTHELDGEVKGLKDFPADQRPPVAIPFFAFRIMVGCGLLMLGACAAGRLAALARTGLMTRRCFFNCASSLTPLGFVAVIAGWFVTEVGRQPWTVYGLLRTAQSVSPSLTGSDVLISLLAYMAGLSVHVSVGLLLMLAHRAQRAGARPPRQSRPIEAGRPEAPVLAGALSVAEGETGMSQVLDFVPIWTLILGMAVFFYVLLDGFDLGVGMLYRPRARYRVAQHDHELDRTDLGRQRDLAGLRRPRAAGRLPARFRHHHPGGLFPDPA